MSIFLNKDSRIIVQGITGNEGSKHTALMLKSGANIVGGVNARKKDTYVRHGNTSLRVFGTVSEAMRETSANVSVGFVPPRFAKEAMMEAVTAEIELMIVITEGIPVHDAIAVIRSNNNLGNKTRIVGPNCPGIITPEESLAGITPSGITGSGPLGLVSKSGTLTYQLLEQLSDIGFSTAIGIGGDPVIGTDFIDTLKAFEADSATKVIVMIGEIGGDAEEKAAEFIKTNITKPVVAYIAGFTAPVGKTMGHAGAIISGSSGTAIAKKGALESCGVKVGKTPSAAAELVRKVYKEQLHSSH